MLRPHQVLPAAIFAGMLFTTFPTSAFAAKCLDRDVLFDFDQISAEQVQTDGVQRGVIKADGGKMRTEAERDRFKKRAEAYKKYLEVKKKIDALGSDKKALKDDALQLLNRALDEYRIALEQAHVNYLRAITASTDYRSGLMDKAFKKRNTALQQALQDWRTRSCADGRISTEQDLGSYEGTPTAKDTTFSADVVKATDAIGTVDAPAAAKNFKDYTAGKKKVRDDQWAASANVFKADLDAVLSKLK